MWSSGFVGRRSFRVPDGNYTVTMVIGSKKKAAQTTIRAENRRLFIQDLKTRKNEFKTVSFVVNKRTPLIDATTKVAINERERKTFTWDDSLTLEITGDAPEVQLVKIERNVDCPTVFLCGNSTVVDQYEEPWASWGQMFSVWFNSEIAIANHAESGLSTQSFLSSRRLDKILSVMKKGDYVIVEFGHNDEKDTRPGSGAWYNFSHNLKIFVDRVRAHGGNIIFCTPTSRRIWESDSLTISNTHGDYPAAIKAVAEREQVPLIDLTSMTKTFFETLGYEESKKALVHYPMGSFEGQTKALADNTHFSSYGAYEISKMVVKGLKQVNSPLVKFIADYWLLKAKSQ
ncbi:MAG: rhamnogalacturonan acetylesterase [Bacteroidaceae bacterium]|nr:rhamnogalacturonan acetylesterase [Bacteroidaceae bacterium]